MIKVIVEFRAPGLRSENEIINEVFSFNIEEFKHPFPENHLQDGMRKNPRQEDQHLPVMGIEEIIIAKDNN